MRRDSRDLGAKQPLVADGDEEVWLDTLDVQRDGAKGLAGVDDECSADLPCALADADEINDAAVRPVRARHADDSRARVDRAEHGFRPAGFRIALDGDDVRVMLSRGFAPGEDIGRVGLRKQDDRITCVDPDIGGGDGHAVADGGNQRDGVGAGAEEFARECAELFRAGDPVRSGEGPGRGFEAHGVEAGRADGLQLRGHVGAVQIGDTGGDFEEVCGRQGFHSRDAGTDMGSKDTLI